MHWVSFCFLALALAASMVMIGCKEDKSSEKDITEFVIHGVKVGNSEVDLEGIIHDNEIILFVPSRTNLTNVAPVITITGTSISPASEEEVDLTDSKFKYVVKAEDDSKKTYYVTTLVGEGGTLNLELVPDGNDNIIVYGLQAAKPVGKDTYVPADYDIVLSRQLTDASGARYNPNLPNQMLVSIGSIVDPSGIYDSIEWRIDEREYNTGYDGKYGGLPSGNKTNWTDKNIVWLNAEDYSFMMKHYITVTAEKDGIEHSKTLTFLVVR